MYHYLVNALKGKPGKADGLVARSDPAITDSEAARSARLREEEQAQRVLRERRRAYSDFMTRTPLGHVLSEQMPAVESMTTTPATAFSVCQTSAVLDTRATGTSVSLAAGGERPSPTETGLAHTKLELTMYEVLAPWLSRRTAMMTRRVLELVPHSAPVAPEAARGEQVGTIFTLPPPFPCQRPFVTLEEAKGALLPFLLVLVQLRHWQACLESLSATLSSEAAARSESTTTTSARLVKALQQLSHVLVAITCATELQTAAMRSHLDLLGGEVTACVATTLQCLRRLTRACGTQEFSLWSERAPAASASAAESMPRESKDAIGGGDRRDGTSTPHPVSAEVVEIQACRLLSLFLYWLHVVHDISTPCLAIEELFLASSTARFNACAATVATAKGATAGAAEAEARETHRCTGLSNAALLRHTDPVPSCVPLAMLLLSGSDASSGSGEDKSPGEGSSPPLASSSDVASSLTALLLFASKGVFEHAQPSSEAHTVIEGLAVEEDSDLGLIVVLTSRLLRYMFVAGASPHLVQVTQAAGPLQSALSLLLARFIAGDRNASALRAVAERTEASQSTSLRSCGAQPHLDAAADFSFPRSSSLASTSQPPSPARSCCSSRAPVPSEQSGRLTRQLRLLGQLSCGLVLLKTLFQQSATTVLDIMDHSFFFDALVTALQVVGSRFTEPSRQGAMAARVLDAAGRRDSDAWADWVRGVETVAAQGTVAEGMSVLLNHALGCPLQFSLTVLSSDPYVDEFLHAYLGLLAACRVVRSTPLAFIAPPPQGMLLGSNGAITASARESRALDTLDQLELTLLKTFLTAYGTPTEDTAPAAAAASAAMEFSITLPPCPEQHPVDSEATDAFHLSGDMDGTGSLTFPLASCIYNLLLKHVLWCVGERERRCGQPLPPPPPPLTPPQAPAPPQQHHLALPLLQSSVSSAALRLSPDTPASTATNTPRLVAQAPPTHPPVSPTLSMSIITPANLPQSAATTLPGHSSLAAITGTGSSDDDPLVLFLVRHGLFRILLHDEHFASAFALAESTAAVDSADSPLGRSRDEEAADRPATTRQRSYLVLYLLSHFLQLRPCDAGSSDGEPIAQLAGAQEGGGASADPNVSRRGACSRSSSNTALSADERQLAQETTEALMTVLRVSTASVSSPCCAVVRCRRRRWCNCLLALLSAATAAPGAAAFAPIHVGEELRAGIEIGAPSAADAKTTPAAAAAVCEALARAGGVEYLLRAAAVAADAGAAGQPANTVSCAWAMQAARSLAKDSTASVRMATKCAESLLLPLLWHPLLRSDGQRLLEALLCRPLVGSGTAVDINVNMRELSLSMVSSTGKVGSDSAATDVHAVPPHCRKLCEGVWRTLCDCVNGSAVGGSGVEMPDAVTSGTRAVSATNADEGARQAVLRAVLGAVGTAFRTLSEQRFSDAGEHSGELLPLRTLQRALFEASKADGQNIYELLLHQLAQSSKAVDNPGTSPRPSPLNTADVAEVAFSPPFPVPFLIAASGAPNAPDTSPAEAMEASTDTVAACRAAREMVRLIVIALVGMTVANPSQREVLYRATVDEEALVSCIVNAWGTTGGSQALPFSCSMGEGDACGIVRVCSYLIYESVDAVDAFFDNDDESGSQDAAPRRRRCSDDASWAWSLQNPMLLAAVLRCFTRLASLTVDQQVALRKLLVSLTRTVESCYVSLYLAASSAVHDVLAQLLPVVALLPEPAALRFSSSVETEAALPRLDAVLVRLLAALAHCHVDARQLKQLLLLVIHSRHQRDRRALVPLVLQVLSEAVQPPLNMTLLHAARRDPQHFVSLHRGRGPAGFCAALPDFPLEGYSAFLNVRWESDVSSQDVAGQTAGGNTTLRQYDACACIFCLRTADRATLLAFMVERRTGRLFVQYRNLQQQKLRVYLAASLLPRKWTHLCISHRAAAFLTATAGGQLTLFVNGAEAAVIPQVAYPLMSRGYLYVGCLGHEVDRLSVAHAFYGQVSTVYFFPYVLPEREREVLQTTVGVADTAAWMLSSSNAAIPPLRPVSFAPGRRPGSSASESAADVDGTEQWLAGRAVVCVDTRLSDRGHLYNLSAVLRGRTGRESRLLTLEGSLVCSTQRLIDSMGVLGALTSVLMPLCVLLVNPNLPISSRSLAAAAPIGSLAHRKPGLPPFSSLGAAAVSASSASDTINATVLRVLDLVPPLAAAEAIRTEMAEARFFVFLGQVLQLLGPALQVVVPAAFVQLLEALAPFPRLFEDALTNLFLSADVIRASPRAVQLTWVKVQRFFLSAHPDALPCLRTLGTSMFVAAELLRVTAEEAKEEELTQEDTLVPAQTQDVVTHPLLSPSSSTSRPISVVASDVSGAPSSATISPFSPSSTPPPPPSLPSCSLQDLENQWMAYFEALTVAPVTLGDAEALQYFVGNLHLTCPKASVQLRLLRRVRQLLVTSNTPYLVQLLGRRNYVVNLMPYLTSASSEAVRLEALLQLLFMVLRSKRTQELMNPVLLASKDTVVHVVEEVSLSWLKDVLQRFPVNLPVYLALRCGLVERFDVLTLPTQYVPLDESHTIRFAAVLLPLLMLMKRSTDTKLKGHVLTDMAVLLKSDAQAWRRVITVRGWYVSVVGLFASSCASSPVSAPSSLQEACACQESTVPGAVSSPTIPTDSTVSEQVQSEGSGLAFATISMILSYTIYQVLLHEAYGATELELVVAYLREQRLHRLLHQVLCRVADRYRSRLMAPWRGERRDAAGNREGPGAPRPSNGCAFLGLGSATAVVNLCHFLRVVEVVLFYAGSVPRRKEAITVPVKPAVSPFTPAGAALNGEEFGTHLPVRVGYTEWEQLTLVRSADDPPGGVAESDVYYAGEVDDPHGNVRRAVLRTPDDRWLHLPLAVKCAELLCSHSALLHLGSNGNTTSHSVGGAGSVVGSGSAGSGGPGDLLWSVVLGASAGTGVSKSPTSPKAGGVGGVGFRAGGGGVAPVVLRGGMLRLFGRLFKVLCQMTLRSGTALSSVVELTDVFVRRLDRGQRGSGFLLLKRAVNAEDAREHSPIAITMTLIYCVHNLLLRRLHAAEYGNTSTHFNANAALVDRLKSLVVMFRYSFEQLSAFASSPRSRSGAHSSVFRQSSLLATAAAWLTGGDREDSAGDRSSGPNSTASCARSNLAYLDDLTGETLTAGVPTLQWLCDHRANPRRTVEAFAEVASRVDYNAFVERCLLAVEREQSTDKALAAKLWSEQRASLRRLQELFAENSMSRRLVHDKIQALMAAFNSPPKTGAAGETDSDSGAADLEGHSSTRADGFAPASFTSLFLPRAARRATAAARANAWTRFTFALRDTVWCADAAGLHNTLKYVKLSSQEQQFLVHRKLVYDRDGTNYCGRAMASYSAPRSPVCDDLSSVNVTSFRAVPALLGDEGESGGGLAFGGSVSASTSRASYLRLRGGESVLLQAIDDDDVGLEEDMMNFSLDGRGDVSTAAAASFSECPLLWEEAAPVSKGAGLAPTSKVDNFSAAPSLLSVPCEVPYMMHCWSGSFTVRGSEVIVLIDDDNKAYNQVVAEEARAYVLRPRPFSFHLSHITQIAPARRFRMRRTALEIWTRDRRSCFVNFSDTATMNAALQAVRCGERSSYMLTAPSFLRDASGAATAALPTLLHEGTGGVRWHSAYVLQENPRREPLRLRATALWRNRLLSNFDYLLVLNLLAGRTLNDMTQYPVFPWVLSDYTSETLDLTNPETFRDLSMPMGACGNRERRELVRQRYMEMRSLGDVPSHYFTHYSSPAITLYFLVRLPPFTTLAILLQGGHFDHADRMFHSMQATFRAVMTSTQDVRELIPELYYLPELCINENHIDFGRRQDRTPMDDLELPPWAHNDPFTFVYRMREALESAHVSAHLHEWIDLIFGYKQRGKDAIDALNVFNWHSYEELDRNREAGSVDQLLLVDSLDNIGQTPIQLFRRPHQPRLPLEWADPLQLPIRVKVMTLRWGCARVARTTVVSTDRVLVVAGSGAAASLRMHLTPIRQSSVLQRAAATPPAASPPHAAASTAAASQLRCAPVGDGVAASAPSQNEMTATHASSHVNATAAAVPGHPATPVAVTPVTNHPAPPAMDSGSFDVRDEYERSLAPIPAGVIPNDSAYADGSCTEASTALLCYDSEVFLVLGGLFDNSVVVRALSGAGRDVRLRAHRGRVVFVARSEDSRYLVTGAEDTTFAVWSCHLQPARQRLEMTMLFTIYGHEGMPSAVDVSSTLDVVATASLNGTLMLHSLSTGGLDRVIRHPHGAPIHRVLLQTTCYVPNILFLSHQDEKVYQCSLNGAALRTFSPPGRVVTWATTASQCLLLACQPLASVHGGGPQDGDQTSCILYLHSFFLEVLKTVPVRAEDVVSSVSAHPSNPQVVVAGTESGRLLLLRSVLV
ncbi:conserved hypothetical protein [Leishmania major strain Friedlin]|uniref:Neurobeachin/beige protein n=1 Tax=Leishmania major TaxID=5664 RepID=Q4Q1Q2_LEIMA|nr:conserved hypothetical protein [Leishmania major strain Friedlin]CAG9583694.1 neurobeachin/beige_protein_-_putative [Leishmania major strain Friedlin]CAJ09127.1 conserved hypothetical protein [Leishmania major strain Friedlin]|eukprot:XP_001686746.1 conserved hypothetical protein [Leishmania major strain Friedlin]